MMRALLTGLLMVAGGAAPAATWVYDYQGQPLSCDPAEDLCDVVGAGPVPGWTGRLAVNEDLLPGGSLADVRISILLDQDGVYSTDVIRGGVTETVTGPGLPAFLQVTGDVFAEFLAFSVVFNDYAWTFGPDREVAGWSGSSFCGGTCDAFSSPSGDGYADGTRSAGPGAWSAPAPIPLPGSVWGLGAGLAALALLARRRRA